MQAELLLYFQVYKHTAIHLVSLQLKLFSPTQKEPANHVAVLWPKAEHVAVKRATAAEPTVKPT